jgi:OOP family OmpA-OmpF porin
MDSNTPLTEHQPMSAAVKRLFIAVAALLAFAILEYRYNIIPMPTTQQVSVAPRADLPSDVAQAPSTGPVAPAALPGSSIAKVGGPLVHMNIWAWNAQMGLIYANGGPTTTSGSLMEKHGVRLRLERQDDTTVSQGAQVKFAEALASGNLANVTEPVQFVVIMGDGAAQYLAGINKSLSKLGPDYRAEIVGAVGYSGNKVAGEDALLGPSDWKEHPESIKGALISGVLRDGDWNFGLDFATKNNIANNPDEKTYDPDAVNWVGVDDYLKAADLYISGYCETRDVVHQNKRTGEKRNVCVNGVVTWTPGDVNIAKKKGGLVKVLSTKENVYQMPAVVIGIHKWNVSNAKTVENLLAAAFEGGDQVRNFPAALDRAGKASKAVYGGSETADYWVKYFKGSIERDKTGNEVELGGSRVNNLGDNLVLFGLTDNSSEDANPMCATYTGFGNVVKQQYPKLVPSFPSCREAVNTSFVKSLASKMITTSKPEEVASFETPGAIQPDNVVAKRDVSIPFDTGKDTLKPEAADVLDTLFNQLVVSGALAIELDGHTDNTGNPTANVDLSGRRAVTVKNYFMHKAPSLFPANRFNVKAFGDTKPVASNTTAEGKAQNRRVTVVLGTK